MKALTIKKSWLTKSDLRLDASYHLSEGQLTLVTYEKLGVHTQPLNKVTDRIFYGGRSRRIYVDNPEHGLPFIKGADIIKADFSALKYISKSRTSNLQEYFLEEGWTVLTRSGTIGNAAFVNKNFISKAASDDIIRVVPKTVPSGLLYAYLSSKYGKALITHGIYGAVIQHIEPEHIQNIPVPILPANKQEEIHNLILQSGKLRVEANELLEDAIVILEGSLPAIRTEKAYISSIRKLNENNLRFDSTTNFTNIQKFYSSISNSYHISIIGELSGKVFTPNIFKRIRVDNSILGIPFLSGSDLLDARPKFDSFLSKKMKNIEDYILKKGWIAIQDAGTIGYVSLINGYLNGVAATNNLVRIVPNDSDNFNPYIFAFLKTQQGQTILKSSAYGSVQKHIDNDQVSRILIPIVQDYELITEKVLEYNMKITEACFTESRAIQLVEKEIEQWQS